MKDPLFPEIEAGIQRLDTGHIQKDRKEILQKMIDYIRTKVDRQEVVRLHFICTHNSRRSHLAQVWAQTLAYYYGIHNVECYSGGTAATALYPMVAETLKDSGFHIQTLSEGGNPVYAIKYTGNAFPVIGFSKTFDADFNPRSDFAAVMTCSDADENCPFIPGAELRIPLTYEDPKAFDNSPFQSEKYEERSIQIATELKHVFSQIHT